MKKLLCLLGTTAILTSASSAIITTAVKPTEQKLQNSKQVKSADNYIQFTNLKKEYDQLSETEQKNIAIAMAKLPTLNDNERNQYLKNSNITFIKNNKAIIENMYLLYNSISKMTKSVVQTTYSLNINWKMINQLIDLDFGDSNNYTPTVSMYGPSHWWTALWDWGFKVNFPEGDVNIMRIVNLLSSLYNGIDFGSLETVLQSGYTFFDYLINIDKHSNDKAEVLYNIVVKTETDFKNSGIPFTDKLYNIFDTFNSILQFYKGQNLSETSKVIKVIIEIPLKMSLEDIGAKYSDILTKTISILNNAKAILNDTLQIVLPNIIWNYLKKATKAMIKADENHNGVNIKFQQFLIPKGFGAQ
ncbi:hypothetical protein [Spiroplasma attinicola]|uniref:hypothetical protein n=1 Tax=Spiroplasma attinicola TaxID=2904537 RepID=UPI002022B412|nr:hypothetical protein [Spiroplasma sp. JKS002670]MCL8209561.1 hypothetical protein [Spiroplasma sp. JKS002670]